MASNASTTVPYYTPDARLTWMHGWARGNIAAGLAPAPNEFAADWAEGAGRDYYEGVLSLAAAYFVVGVLFFALIVVVNLAAFCCRSAAAKRRRGACARTLACLTAPAYWYLAACALMGVLTAVALSQTVQFKTTVDSTVTGLTTLQSVLSQVDVDSGVLQAATASLNTHLAAITADSPGCDFVAAGDPTWESVLAGGAALTASSASLEEGVATTVSTLGAIVSSGSGQFVVANLGRNVFIGASAALGLYLAFLLLVGVTLLPKPFCACTFRVCNVLLVIVFLLTWIFAGGMLMVSVVGADICVNVPGALGAIATQTAGTGNPVDADTLTYYAGCRSADGSVAPPVDSSDGAAYDAVQAQAAIPALQAGFAAFVSQRDANWVTACQLDVDAVNADFTALTQVTATLVADSACLVVNNVYQPIAAALCNTGIFAMTNVWALATVCALVILVMTVAGVRLCWRHPGDPVDDDDGDADSVRLTQAWTKAGAAGGAKAPRGSARAAAAASSAPAYVVSNAAAGYGATAAPADWTGGRR